VKIKIDTTLSATDDVLVEISSGQLNPQAAFMKGKLKITGNIMLTQKLLPLLKEAGVGANKTAVKKLQSDVLFSSIQEKIDSNPDKAKSVNGVFLYRILEGGNVIKEWTLDLKNGLIHEGKPEKIKIDTTLSAADDVLVEISSGKLNPQAAFMKGKLKITGNIMLTQKLLPLLKEAGVGANKTASKKLQSDVFFSSMQSKIDANPEKVKLVNGIFLYRILEGGNVIKEWTLDLKSGKIHEGKPEKLKIDTTLSAADDVLMEIASGKLNPQAAFMKGKLKITGNIMLTQKLLPLLKDAGVSENKTSKNKLQSDLIFKVIEDRIKANPKKFKSVNGIFLYRILENGKVVKEWVIDFKNAIVHSEKPDGINADTILTVSDEDLVQIAIGKMSPQAAFLKGQLKIAGKILLAQKLLPLMRNEAKL